MISINGFKSTPVVSVDTETTGLDYWSGSRAFAVSLCDQDGGTAFVRWLVDPYTRKVLTCKEDVSWLKTILENRLIRKVFFNLPFDRRMLWGAGIKLTGPADDTKVMLYCFDSARYVLGLKEIAERFLKIPADDEKALKESTKKARALGKAKGWKIAEELEADYWLADPDLLEQYAVYDAVRTMALYCQLQSELETNKKAAELYYDIEKPLVPVLYDMETRGVLVDRERLRIIKAEYEKHQACSLQEIHRIAGPDFNPNSDKQKRELLFGKLGLKPTVFCTVKKSRIYSDCQACKGAPGGCKICGYTGFNPSTNADFLQSVGVKRDAEDKPIPKEPTVFHILRNQACKTMLAQLEGFEKHTDKLGILHGHFNQTGTITGRQSANNPNLQNVSSDESNKRKTDIAYRSREVFIPRPGFLFYIPDFSQIEVWVLALLGGDRDLIEALANGGDAHQIVADTIWGDTYDREAAKKAKKKAALGVELSHQEEALLKLTKTIRKRAKNLQFCMIYGGGIDKIASMVGCSVQEAEQYLVDYHRRLPGVRRFMDSTIRAVKKDGHIINPFGLKVSVPKECAYVGTNYMVQGTAAYVQKRALIRLAGLARKRFAGNMFLLLNIHDETMLEVSRSVHSKETMQLVSTVMGTDTITLGAPCPFPVGMKIAEERWSLPTEME